MRKGAGCSSARRENFRRGDALSDQFAGLVGWIFDVIYSLGYLGLVALENLLPPIPSEVILPRADFLVSWGRFSFVPALVASIGRMQAATTSWPTRRPRSSSPANRSARPPGYREGPSKRRRRNCQRTKSLAGLLRRFGTTTAGTASRTPRKPKAAPPRSQPGACPPPDGAKVLRQPEAQSSANL